MQVSRSCQIHKSLPGNVVHIVNALSIVYLFYHHDVAIFFGVVFATGCSLLLLDLSSCGARSGTVEVEEGCRTAGIPGRGKDTGQLFEQDYVSEVFRGIRVECCLLIGCRETGEHVRSRFHTYNPRPAPPAIDFWKPMQGADGRIDKRERTQWGRSLTVYTDHRCRQRPAIYTVPNLQRDRQTFRAVLWDRKRSVPSPQSPN